MHRGTGLVGHDWSMVRLGGDRVGMGQLWPLSFPLVKEQLPGKTPLPANEQAISPSWHSKGGKPEQRRRLSRSRQAGLRCNSISA
jgi:hypothetical protein